MDNDKSWIEITKIRVYSQYRLSIIMYNTHTCTCTSTLCPCSDSPDVPVYTHCAPHLLVI